MLLGVVPVKSTMVQCFESQNRSAISSETVLFDRLTAELTTGFVSTDKPMGEILGKSLGYTCRKDEMILRGF